ncbi:hypothetical protein [Paenibacillus tundrae]|uniref:prenyltransferase/squalene oxidase repeat-containing protein n=1 Tax=Paenibacillus tundrae TaxID=528187 RepID=UPI0022A91CC2|nr:hypothetical protein [Paenibacillus tundrae]
MINSGCNTYLSNNDVNYFSNDITINSNEKLITLLQRSYFFNGDIAGFNSVAFMNNDPTLYSIMWILKLMESTDVDMKSVTNLNELIDRSQRTNWEIENVRTLTDINRIVEIDAFNKDEFIHNLESHFDQKNSLFFWEKQDESFEEKLSATVIAISALKHLDPDSIFLKKVKGKLISLYSDDSFFETVHISDGSINNGEIIILGLKELNITPKSLPQEKYSKRKEWVFEMNNQIPYNNYDFLSIIALNNLISLNQFFKIELDLKPYLSSLFAERISFSDLYQNNQLVVDPQYLYLILQLCLYSEYDFPYITELDDYIRNSIKTSFSNTLNPVLKVDDNYFGVYLAKFSGFTNSREKLNKLTSDWHTILIDENISIKDGDKLKNIYFLTKTEELLDIDFKKNHQLPQSIEIFLDSLLSDSNTSDMQKIVNILFSLEILNDLKLEPNKNLREKIINFIKIKILDEVESEIKQSIYICDVYKIMYLLGTPSFNKKDFTLVTDSIERLYDSGGFKNSTRQGGEPDIFSTLKGVKTLSLMSNLDEARKKEINQFLNSVSDNELIYTISPMNVSTDLRTIAAGINIEHLIRGDAK